MTTFTRPEPSELWAVRPGRKSGSLCLTLTFALCYGGIFSPAVSRGQSSTPVPVSPASSKSQVSQNPATLAPASSSNILTQLDDALTEIVQRTRPTIVLLEGVFMPTGNSIPSLENLLPLGLLPGLPDPETVGLRVTGSGFVMRGGFVVTTAEVAVRIREPLVTMWDGRRARAYLIKHDIGSNIAVFRVSGISPELGVTWGASEKVLAGNLAITIGNQAGYTHSASLGMIAGTGRMGRSGELRYSNLLQFQGTVGAGNSGSPLFNARGELIGMIVATPASAPPRSQITASGVRVEVGESPFSNLASVGFAIPANDVRAIAEQLREGKTPRARQGWIGFYLEPTNEMGGKETPATIRALYMDSPAERAGLKPGDIVLTINGKPPGSPHDLRALLRAVRVGEPVQFKVQRGEKTLLLTVLPDPRPDEETIRKMRRHEKTKPGESDAKHR